MQHQKLIAAALDAGAAKAAVIRGADVVLSASFREICAGNGCGNFGRCWMCPPDIGDISALMDEVRRYSKGLLYQTVSEIEDSFDIEGMLSAGRRHAQVSQRLEARVKPLLMGHLHLSCGGCRLCERCAKADGLPCRHPHRALAPMEGYGIDVYNTAKPTDLKYINGPNTVTFFGLVLFSQAHDLHPTISLA